jgi:hypothetical protein
MPIAVRDRIESGGPSLAGKRPIGRLSVLSVEPIGFRQHEATYNWQKAVAS